ncbi:DNA-binding NarL/FixJ family response regulator [Actinoplanes couchii]|uniref:Two component transcriptional regulator, LuxR family n=1 Tax=Actinoplanes couchii TaxID=403638 RepID=A0ABQ3X126_9ACTN|nr:DNA-binding NarL/FixJ family response regulator [Actinoplanes couchii]GID52154.1 hypothetical protein Aco03nite_005580 [Actinoplanes couchii]
MTGPLRVLIADAAPLQRAGLRAVLTTSAGSPPHPLRDRQPSPTDRQLSPADRQPSPADGQRGGPPAGERDASSQQEAAAQRGSFPTARATTAGSDPGTAGHADSDDRSDGRREIVVAGEARDGAEAIDLARRLLPDVLIVDVDLPKLDGPAVARAITEARLAVRVLVLSGTDTNDTGTHPNTTNAGGTGTGARSTGGNRMGIGTGSSGTVGTGLGNTSGTGSSGTAGTGLGSTAGTGLGSNRSGVGGALSGVGGSTAADDEVVAVVAAGATGYLRKDSPPEELVAAIHAVAAGGAVIAPRILARVLDRLTSALSTLPDANALSRLSPLTAREREVLVQVARGHSNSEIAGAFGVSETTVKTHVRNVLTKLRLRDRTQAVILAYETGLIRPRL